VTDSVLAQRIRRSFDARLASDAISGVKQAVGEYFRSTDPAVFVERTDYFNHSFAPDLVLRWPREQAIRYVYLRTNSNPDWLLEDISHIGDREPVVMTLTDTDNVMPLEQVSTSAQQHNTMVTEPGMLESLSAARRKIAAAGLLGSALLQGGRGVVGEARAEAAVSTTSGGFDAAEVLDREHTGKTTALLSDLLNGKQSSRLTRLLLAIWEGHGGASSNFPATFDITAKLNSADLRYLLESVEADDADFWRRIGRGLSLEMVTQIPSEDMPVTFQYLIEANVTTLVAKAVRIVPSETQLSDEAEVFEWAIAGRNLTVRSNNFTAHLAASTLESLPSVPTRDGPSIGVLGERADLQALNIAAIRLKNPTSSVTYESAPEVNAITDQGFADLAVALGPETRIAEVTVSLRDGKRLFCDFEESTAKGHTNAVFAISQLLGIAVPLMFSVDQMSQVKLMLLATQTPVGADGGRQLELFDKSAGGEETPL
jgi:hypothetical protein